jgi:hypothetical protein
VSVVDDVRNLVLEVDRLRVENAALRGDLAAHAGRQVEVVRMVYRRGYRAGWTARRQGREHTTAPERHARTEVRRMLAGGAS